MFSPTVIKTIGIGLLLVVLCLLMIPLTDGVFFKPENVQNLISRTSMFGILAIGVAFVIISSGIDLSIGSIVCLIACLIAMFLQVDYVSSGAVKVGFVSKADQTIVLRGHTDQFEVGDTIRFFGSRRARTLVANVTEAKKTHGVVESGSFLEDSSKGIDATLLKLDQAPSNSDTEGLVAPTYAVELPAEAAGSIRRLPASLFPFAIRPRDRILFVDTASNRQNEATVAEVTDSEIVLTTDVALGSFEQPRAIHSARQPRMSVPVALGLVTLVAVSLGLLHGFLIAYVKLQPFIVTLCGLLIYRGAARWLVSDQPVGFRGEYIDSLSQLAKGKVMLTENFGIPYPALVLLLVAVLAIIFLNFTVWGRYLQAMGRNEEAAKYSGIRTSWITVAAYVIGVVLAALGGVLFALEYDSVSPSSFGNSYELYAIAAAVLGGCSLRGGEGSVIGVVLGTAVLQVLNNMIVLAKISDTLELAVIGMVILLGVLADEVGRRVLAAYRSKQAVT